MRRSQPLITLPLFLGLALVASQALAADFTGRVVGVADGDILVAPPAVAIPILDTPPRTA